MLAYFNYPRVECGMATAARKKALVLWVTGAFLSVFESKKEEDNFQPTKKRRTKLSPPKGKQRSKLKHHRWKSVISSISKRYVLKIPTTHWAVLTYKGLCHTRNQRSAVLKPKTESMNTPMKAIAGWRLSVLGETKEGSNTTNVAWKEMNPCSGLQWSCCGLSWRCISRQRTVHWMGTCWLHGVNISVFGVSRLAVSRFPPETNTEPGIKVQYTPCPLGSEL